MSLYYKELLNFQNLNNYLQIKKILKKPVYGSDYFKMLSNSKICINTFMQTIKSFQGNVGLFDVTGQGSLLVTDKTKDSNQFFIPDEECVEYDNADEAVDKIKWLFKKSKKMLEIAENGRKKTLEFFSYKKSVKKLKI